MVKFAVLCEWSLLWVSECMRQARDLPRHHSHLAQHYHERMMAQRMARVSYIQFTKQASLAHHVKILVWSTNSSKKLRRKAQGARRLWPPCSDWTQKYFFNKVWESWWGMPQVKTSFSFNQQIHKKNAPKGTGNSAAIAATLCDVENPNTSMHAFHSTPCVTQAESHF